MERSYNRYNDVELDTRALDQETPYDALLRMIQGEECIWRNRMVRYTTDRMKFDAAIMWLKLDRKFFKHLHALVSDVNLCFTVHHATDAYLMLVRRRSDTVNKIVNNAPPYATHYVKIECLVVETGDPVRYLLVRERYASGPNRTHIYKLVTGVVVPGERIDEACVREVMEETGILCEFIGMIGTILRIGTRFGKDELIIGCVLHAKPGQNPIPDRRELECAFWEPTVDAMRHCNGPATRWIKAAGRAGTQNLLSRRDSADLRGGSHFVSTYTFNHHPSPHRQPCPSSSSQTVKEQSSDE